MEFEFLAKINLSRCFVHKLQNEYGHGFQIYKAIHMEQTLVKSLAYQKGFANTVDKNLKTRRLHLSCKHKLVMVRGLRG